MQELSPSWRCFHCGDLFTNPKHAAAHFGIDQLATPGCVAVLRGGESHLLDRILSLEEEVQRARAEDTDIMRWGMAKESLHRTALANAEQRGYDKGIADLSKHELVVALQRMLAVFNTPENSSLPGAEQETCIHALDILERYRVA